MNYKKNIDIINKVIQPFVDRTLTLKSHSMTMDKDFTLLHAMSKQTQSRKKIRDELMGLLLAGRDTTAVTLSWLFYELAAHPQVVYTLRDEMRTILGDDNMHHAGRAPTLVDIKRMRYLHHVVNETLRLYPAVPINIRYATRDTTLSLDSPSHPLISVRRGDAVVYSPLFMQRRADLYPPVSPQFPHPEVFAPERWDHWTPTPWTYVPFNGGPRICIGQQFALTEIWYTVVRILQRFDRLERVDPAVEERQQCINTALVGSPGQEIKVRFWESRDAAAM